MGPHRGDPVQPGRPGDRSLPEPRRPRRGGGVVLSCVGAHTCPFKVGASGQNLSSRGRSIVLPFFDIQGRQMGSWERVRARRPCGVGEAHDSKGPRTVATRACRLNRHHRPPAQHAPHRACVEARHRVAGWRFRGPGPPWTTWTTRIGPSGRRLAKMERAVVASADRILVTSPGALQEIGLDDASRVRSSPAGTGMIFLTTRLSLPPTTNPCSVTLVRCTGRGTPQRFGAPLESPIGC